jgi:large subunit ribosomal protein L22
MRLMLVVTVVPWSSNCWRRSGIRRSYWRDEWDLSSWNSSEDTTRHGSSTLYANVTAIDRCTSINFTVFSRLLSSHSQSINVIPIRRIEASGSDFGATTTLEAIPSQDKAENFAAYAHANRHQKVKPFIIKRRIKQLRTYEGAEKGIRHSPWRMNLVCQFAAGLTVPEALKQLMFCQKRMAPLVAKVIRDTANEADRRDGLQPSQLEVAECFSTHGSHLKRIKIMGRGR